MNLPNPSQISTLMSSNTLYELQYETLQKWAHRSLDMFKSDFLSILWPVFVHVFLFLLQRKLERRARNFLQAHKGEHELVYGGPHGDIRKLETITTWAQLPPPWGDGSSKNTSFFLQKHSKFSVWTSKYSFELLLTFVEHNKLLLMLHILNQHVDIMIFEGKPDKRPPGAPLQTIVRRMAVSCRVPRAGEIIANSATLKVRDAGGREAETLNQRKVRWGLMPEELSVRPEARRAIIGATQLASANDEFRQSSPKKIKSAVRSALPGLRESAPKWPPVPFVALTHCLTGGTS